MADPVIVCVASNLVGSGAQNITLTFPTGGPNGDVSEDDVVLAFVMSSQLADVDCQEVGGTYSELFDRYEDGTTNDTNFAGFYKVQTATPDTSVTLKGRTSNGGLLGIAVAIRGLDLTTQLDVAITITGAPSVASASASPQAPANTPVTVGAVSLIVGGSSDPDAVTNAPTGYTHLVDVQQTVRNAFAAYQILTTLDEVTPAAWTDITSDADDSWVGAHILLRPAATGVVVAPSATTAAGAVVTPTVVLGSLSITPAACAAVGAVVDPGVELGDLSITPATTTAAGSVVNPSVLDSFAFTPASVDAVGAVVDPTVDISSPGGVEVQPAAAVVSGIVVDPTVVQGSLTIAPTQVEASCEASIEGTTQGLGWKFGTQAPLSSVWTPDAPPPYSPYI